MGLKNKLNDTVFRSLKYGGDTPGGGSSGQPYIKAPDLNRIDSGINKVRIARFDDGLVRGGTVGSLRSSITDNVRITKFFSDFPTGPLFILKQVGLQLSNPKPELRGEGRIGSTQIYNFGANTLAQVTVNAFGQHIPRHGSFLRQDSQDNYFNVVKDKDKQFNSKLIRLSRKLNYIDQAKQQSDFSRLTRKESKKASRLLASGPFGGEISSAYISNIQNQTIDSYISGPGSVYGIGSTKIRRFAPFLRTVAEGQSDKNTSGKSYVSNIEGSIRLSKEFTTSDFTINTFELTSIDNLTNNFQDKDAIITDTASSKTQKAFSVNIKNTTHASVYKESRLNHKPFGDLLNSDNLTNSIQDTEAIITDTASSKTKKSFIVTIKDTTQASVYSKSKYGYLPFGNLLDSGNTLRTTTEDRGFETLDYKHKTSYLVNFENAQETGSNAISTYTSSSIGELQAASVQGKQDSYKDLKKEIDRVLNKKRANPIIHEVGKKATYAYFTRRDDINEADGDQILTIIFTPIDPFNGEPLTTIMFSGYISGYKENYGGEWNSFRYIGRGEQFFTYKGINRTGGFSLQIPNLKKSDKEINKTKLENLSKINGGKYNERGLLGGIITRISVGGYLIDAPCIITSIDYDVPDDAPWDVADNDEHYLTDIDKRAMVIKANISYNIIGNELWAYQDPIAPPVKSDTPVEDTPTPPKTEDTITPTNRFKSIPETNIDSTLYKYRGEAGYLQGQQQRQSTGDLIYDKVRKRNAEFSNIGK